jgi:5S rRNA maturation endonuclease (ribonuclease M5)
MNVRKFEYIIDNLEKLKDLSQDMPIIVEGKRDERALRNVGVEGEILKVQTSRSVVEFCDRAAGRYSEVILFTDLDAAGKKIGSLVKKYLTDKGVKVNGNIAKKLMHALDTAEAENVSKRLEKAYRRFNYP